MPSDTTIRSRGTDGSVTQPITAGGIILIVFMATMVLPVSVEVAGLRLTPIRILLLLSFVPLFGRLLTDEHNRFRGSDICLILFCIWMGATLVYHEGTSKFAFAGISVVELFGGYLMSRVLVRSKEDYRLFIKAYLSVMVFLFPFAFFEFITGRQILGEILDKFGTVEWRPMSSRPRMGFDRVISGFEHPILYGLFCSLSVSNILYLYRNRSASRVFWAGFSTFMTFMSLSSGAFLSVIIQFQIILWGVVTRNKWKLLIGIVSAAYIFLSIASNRGPIIIFIETFTFNSGNAWTRVLQWQYGGAEVMRNPILGIGLTANWERPPWLVNSIDNYWLVLAMRYGLPGVGTFILGIFLVVWKITRVKNLSPEISGIRTGYMIGLVGMCFTLSTVHVWGAVSVFVMFYLGAGVWIADVDTTAPRDDDEAPDPTPVSRYTRFAPRHDRSSGT